jgi:hypothetical protein
MVFFLSGDVFDESVFLGVGMCEAAVFGLPAGEIPVNVFALDSGGHAGFHVANEIIQTNRLVQRYEHMQVIGGSADAVDVGFFLFQSAEKIVVEFAALFGL